MTQSTRARQADRRRADLLDVALALFAEKGFASTTIADIATVSGTAHGLVYHYFRSKDELLLAVLERNSFLPALRQLLAVAPDQPATEVLPQIASGFSAMIAERRDFMSVVLRESHTNPEVAAAMGQLLGEALELMTAYVAGRIEAGELRAHDPSVTARTLFQAIVAGHLNRLPAPGFRGRPRRRDPPRGPRPMMYLNLKFLHVGSMFVATALAIGPIALYVLILRTGDAHAIRRAFRFAEPLSRVGGIAYGVGVIFGVVTALNGGIGLTTPWLVRRTSCSPD